MAGLPKLPAHLAQEQETHVEQMLQLQHQHAMLMMELQDKI